MIDLDEIREGLLAAVGSAFRRANQAGQLSRAHLYELTMSGLGGCMRQAAYRLAAVPPTDPHLALEAEARAAMIGTWIHAGLLEHLAHFLGEDIMATARHELPVCLPVDDVKIHGSADLYTDALEGGVVDVKTLYAYGLGHMDDEHAKEDHRWQVLGYSCAVALTGLPVRWVAWLYIDRSNGECLPILEEFTEETREEVIDRVRMLADFSEDPGSAPRQYGNGRRVPGPGNFRCDTCPWLRECFGPDARPGDASARRVLAEEEPEGLVWAMRGYRAAHEQYRRAKEEKEFFASVIKALQPVNGAVYGGLQYRLGKPSLMLDTAEAERRLRAAGIPVPRKPRSPSTYVRPARK